MTNIAYVNGRYVPLQEAQVSIEDRGYQFADGVYEVIAFYNRRLLDEKLHMQRLTRSLKELRIAAPMSDAAFRLVIRELIERNNREHGTLYVQITRGTARRDHTFPKHARPNLVMAVTGPKMPKAKDVDKGISVITLPDIRWERRDIKSISLLPNILAKQSAMEAGAKEAWLYDGKGVINEGSSSNNAIVTAKGEIMTSPTSNLILGGITRAVLLDIARKNGFKVVEKSFSVKQAKEAKEAFMLSTTSNVLPVTSIDGVKVGNGKPGATTLKLLALYHEHIYRETGYQWQ
ncbi:MAG TPA: D-amino-acid transaminase [Rickettsiales bacterium]|nr:D-amino-acid transaminase [Rickettsiales bacterium]